MGEGLGHTCFQGLEKLCLGAAVLPVDICPLVLREWGLQTRAA